MSAPNRKKPTTHLTISAKNLGELALPTCCPRCFWLKLKLAHRLPFSFFPGIFSSIDSYSKNVVHDYFDRHGKAPDWLDGLGELTGYVNPPHWSKFSMLDREHLVVVRGTPDGILVRRDGHLIIADYKTARYTKTQDELLPMYQVQLNAYAAIAESLGLGTIAGLALIYMEPVTVVDNGCARKCHETGFDMGFTAHIVHVEIDPQLLPPLIARTRSIFQLSKPPTGSPGCRNCEAMGTIRRLMAG